MEKLVDTHGRHIHKLRLSLLDTCNFRCIYCMPQNPIFLPTKALLSRNEFFEISKILVGLGIDEIRLTGGEPTIRSDFMGIVKDISSLDLKRLGLTTNGVNLKKYLPLLKETNCSNINFSMDSLNEKTFLKTTGSKDFKKVFDSLLTAKELGFNIKVNCVLMRGINDHEISDFIEFSGKYDVEIRFLELMRIGPGRNKFNEYFVSADEVVDELKKFSPLESIELPKDSTSFNFKLSNNANIGLIASESRPFCGDCSRLRLSAIGEIRPCLMLDKGFSLRGKSSQEIENLLFKTMALKPTERIYEVVQPMNQIGG